MFNLKNASREIRKIAAAQGVKTGEVEFRNLDRTIDACADDVVIATVKNSRKQIDVTAGDVRYGAMYLA